MDRDALLYHLAQAERHIALGEERICRQRDLIASLERGGYDLTLARNLLHTYEQSQALHLADRARIRSALAKA
jgi:hypothetical protein